MLFIARARHTSLVFPGNCIADTRVTSGERNFFSINAPGMGHFKLFDLMGYS